MGERNPALFCFFHLPVSDSLTQDAMVIVVYTNSLTTRRLESVVDTIAIERIPLSSSHG